jgi:hypothetical protein
MLNDKDLFGSESEVPFIRLQRLSAGSMSIISITLLPKFVEIFCGNEEE